VLVALLVQVAVIVVELVNATDVSIADIVAKAAFEAPSHKTNELAPTAVIVAVLLVFVEVIAIVPCVIELTPEANSTTVKFTVALSVVEASRVAVTVVELVIAILTAKRPSTFPVFVVLTPFQIKILLVVSTVGKDVNVQVVTVAAIVQEPFVMLLMTLVGAEGAASIAPRPVNSPGGNPGKTDCAQSNSPANRATAILSIR
jgi:hypothetical protein